VELGHGAEEAFVDSAQISSAVANILTNAIESYDEEIGPIKITADLEPSKRRIRLQIMDLGCGMDEGTVRKAIQPFYSAKTAGRRRGMGLAYAARFVQINGGSLEIESHVGIGTTVAILLPCA
jgi:signal transduction histidine kinase